MLENACIVRDGWSKIRVRVYTWYQTSKRTYATRFCLKIIIIIDLLLPLSSSTAIQTRLNNGCTSSLYWFVHIFFPPVVIKILISVTRPIIQVKRSISFDIGEYCHWRFRTGNYTPSDRPTLILTFVPRKHHAGILFSVFAYYINNGKKKQKTPPRARYTAKPTECTFWAASVWARAGETKGTCCQSDVNLTGQQAARRRGRRMVRLGTRSGGGGGDKPQQANCKYIRRVLHHTMQFSPIVDVRVSNKMSPARLFIGNMVFIVSLLYFTLTPVFPLFGEM